MIQLLLTIAISLSIRSTALKAAALLLFWAISFWPLSATDILAFFVTNVIFVFSNYGALKNGVFEFAQKNVLLMPYNELFMWGFYCLFAKRTLGIREISTPKQRRWSIAYAATFAVSFSVIRNEIGLALFLGILLLAAASYLRNRQDRNSILLFAGLGILIEGTGIWKGFWHYPHARYLPLPLWGPLMWANIGLIVSRLMPLLGEKKQSRPNPSKT